MDTVRVDITYRPLRIGWAIKSGDKDALRKAVQYSYSLWGGRANPILVTDDLEQARELASLYRIDLIWPIGEIESVKNFPKNFSHLISPVPQNRLYMGAEGNETRCAFLDIHNALVHGRDGSEIKGLREAGFKLYKWAESDPLANIFSIQFGEYPDKSVGIDYWELVRGTFDAEEVAIDQDEPISTLSLNHPGIRYLCRHGMEVGLDMEGGWNSPGFYLGDARDFDDLACFWNLQASGIPLLFVDPAHAERYAEIVPAWGKMMREQVANNQEWNRRVALWSRAERGDNELPEIFSGMELMQCRVTDMVWNGLNIRAPRLAFPSTTTLGILGKSNAEHRPRVSFALSSKPFSSDPWFHTQHLVASVSFIGGLYGDESYLLQPPFIPELNEFYARTLHFDYSKLRIEASGIGVIIDAADTNISLNALATVELFKKIFAMAGYEAKHSKSGLLARQLISRMGGLQGLRVFKIAGVRRLIRSFGLNATFSKSNALNLIASVDPDDPEKKFSDYSDLYIEQRKVGVDLKPADVFARLVDKGLFRLGADLTCPSCGIPSWVGVDALRQRIECEFCGQQYETVRQLVGGEWRYRRSGILGAERNVQGAIPVALTLQQFDTAFGHGLRSSAYSPSLDLTRVDASDNECEIDFVWLSADARSAKISLVIGECKDRGPIKIEEFRRDVENLKAVASRIPAHRFDVFIVLVKLSAFTDEELEAARMLNEGLSARVILLTDRELEPYYLTDAKSGFGHGVYMHSPLDLAIATHRKYFSATPKIA